MTNLVVQYAWQLRIASSLSQRTSRCAAEFNTFLVTPKHWCKPSLEGVCSRCVCGILHFISLQSPVPIFPPSQRNAHIRHLLPRLLQMMKVCEAVNIWYFLLSTPTWILFFQFSIQILRNKKRKSLLLQNLRRIKGELSNFPLIPFLFADGSYVIYLRSSVATSSTSTQGTVPSCKIFLLLLLPVKRLDQVLAFWCSDLGKFLFLQWKCEKFQKLIGLTISNFNLWEIRLLQQSGVTLKRTTMTATINGSKCEVDSNFSGLWSSSSIPGVKKKINPYQSAYRPVLLRRQEWIIIRRIVDVLQLADCWNR